MKTKYIIITFISVTALLGLLIDQLMLPSQALASLLKRALHTPTTQVTHGAHLRPVAEVYGQEILDFNELTGKDIGVLMYFIPWNDFDPYLPNLIQSQVPEDQQPVIMLTWEPSTYSSGCNLGYSDGNGPLRSIISGRCDSYIRSFAQALNARSERFLLRLAHEMNTADYPWGHAYFNHGSNAPTYYVTMFQHVHQIFEEEGVDNVEWVWSPNYASNPNYEWNTIYAYYPGDAYVDWIGLSGYNWGGHGGNAPWVSFGEIYDSVLQDLACRYAKPQIVAEIGSVDDPGSSQTKEEWITDAYQSVPNYPFVRSIVWFNDYAFGDSDNADFRVTTSSRDYGEVVELPLESGTWTKAYRDGVTDAVYTSALVSLNTATPPQTYCGEAPSITVTPSTGLAVPGDTVHYHVRGFGYTESLAISVDLPDGVGLVASPSPDALEPFWDQSTVIVETSTSTPTGTHSLTIQVGSDIFPVDLKVLSSLNRIYLPAIYRE